MDAVVMEMVSFRLAKGASERSLVEQAGALGRWLEAREGFVERTLTGPDGAGRYTDLVKWTDLPAAQAAAEAFMAEPSLEPMRALIDSSSVDMRHLPVLPTLG